MSFIIVVYRTKVEVCLQDHGYLPRDYIINK